MAFRPSGLGDFVEEGEEPMGEDLVTHSPEPQEPLEPEVSLQPDENSQVDRLHPEQDLPHIFKVSASEIFIVLSLLLELNLPYMYGNIVT